MESKTGEKVILDNIPTNTEYKHNSVITTSFTHKVNPKTVDDAGTLYKIKNWKSKGRDGVKLERKLLLIDEKPQLTKVNDISEKTIDELSAAVSKISENDFERIRQDKKIMKQELENVKNTLKELVAKFEKYRNAYVKLQQPIFSADFLELWNQYLKYKHKDLIDAITDMFSNGAIYCKTGKYDIFKTISMSNFFVQEFKTLIFDGTAELSLEYDIGDFNLMKVEDFREYSNITFHTVKGNYSKARLNKNIDILSPIVAWINKNVSVPTYLVSHMAVSGYLYDELNSNEHIVSYNSSNQSAEIPYSVEVIISACNYSTVNLMINKSPAIKSPHMFKEKKQKNIWGMGVNVDLNISDEIEVTININSPVVPITSDGKEPDLSKMKSAIDDAIQKAVRKFKANSKSASGSKDISNSQKAVILAHLAEGVAKASGNGIIRFSL